MSELKSYEGYCVGASIGELTQAVDQSMIDAYAGASGDINP